MGKKKRTETEIKLAVGDRKQLRRALAAAKAKRRGRVHEFDTLFDTPKRKLARTGSLLRVRLKAKKGLLTYKGPAAKGSRYKSRTEIEVPIRSPQEVQTALEALGLKKWFQYEKYRTSHRLPGLPGLAVEVDETPIGVYLELEGPKKAIDRGARLLGYSPSDYITASYYDLYLRDCRKKGVQPRQMVFSKKK